MKYNEMAGIIVIAVLGVLFSLFFNIEKNTFQFLVIFTLLMIVASTVLLTVTLRAYFLFKTFDTIYFSVSYSFILLLLIYIFTKQISYNIFNLYYFYSIKYIELIIIFFGFFVIKNDIKQKRLVMDLVLLSMLNLFYFFFIMKMYHINYLGILINIELIYLYWKIDNKNTRSYWIQAIIYKLTSEFFLLTSEYNSSLKGLYILAYVFYLMSLIKIILYFNNSLNKGYFKQMFLKEKKFNKLIGIMSDGIIVTSGYFIKRINKSGLEILGYNNKREIVGKNIFSAFEGVKKEDIDNAVKNYPKESRIEFKKYNEKDRKIKSAAFKVAGDYLEESVIIFKKDSFLENGLTKFNNSLNIVSFIFEEGYGFKYISKRASEIFNKNIEAIYKNSEIITEQVSEKDREKYLTTISKGGKSEIQLKSYSGKQLNFLLNSSLVTIDDKEVCYGVMIDITEFKEREIKLEKKNFELEERNAKKEMGMSIVSHEIRTPITAIIGFVENILINKENTDPDLIRMIQKVYGNSMRLKELVNNFLDYNKLNAGKMELSKENIEINALVEEIMTNNEMLMEIKGITRDNAVKKGIYIYADATMMYQVINNLISNAIKYNKENGTIKAEAEINGNIVIIKICDTGVGIKPENIESVFKEYERVKGVKEKGTGLGMPIAKRLVEINGGSIWLTSEYGKGSCFHISMTLSSF